MFLIKTGNQLLRANKYSRVAQGLPQNIVRKPTYLLELNLFMFKKFNKN